MHGAVQSAPGVTKLTRQTFPRSPEGHGEETLPSIPTLLAAVVGSGSGQAGRQEDLAAAGQKPDALVSAPGPGLSEEDAGVCLVSAL